MVMSWSKATFVGAEGWLSLFGRETLPPWSLPSLWAHLPGERQAAAASTERLICKMEMHVLTPFVILSALVTAQGTVQRRDLDLTGKNQWKLTYPLDDLRTESTLFLEWWNGFSGDAKSIPHACREFITLCYENCLLPEFSLFCLFKTTPGKLQLNLGEANPKPVWKDERQAERGAAGFRWVPPQQRCDLDPKPLSWS